MECVVLNKSVSNLKPKSCLCGCGEYIAIHKYPRKNGQNYIYRMSNFIKGHDKRGVDGFDSEIHKLRLCLCGCGQFTKKFRGRFNRFIKGHENIGRVPWNKNKQFSETTRKK